MTDQFFEGSQTYDVLKKQVEALCGSEQQLSRLIYFLPDATFAVDCSGKIIAWNRAMEEMTGVKAEDILGKGDYEYALPFYGVRRPMLIDLVLKPNAEAGKQYYVIKKDNDGFIAVAETMVKGDRILWVKAVPFYNSSGEIIGAIEMVRDVFEPKLNVTFDRTNQMVGLYTLEGALLEANQATLDMLGVRLADIKNKLFWELPWWPHPLGLQKREQDVALQKALVQRAARGEFVDFSAELYDKNGKIYYFDGFIYPVRDNENKIVFLIAEGRDVSKHKNIEIESKRNYDIQSVISALLKLSLEGLSLDQILDRSLDIILNISWFDFEKKAAIFKVGDEPNVLVMSAQRGLSSANRDSCRSIAFGQCLCGKAAQSKESEFSLDVDVRHTIKYEGIISHSHYCVPIISADKKTIGVLVIYSQYGHQRDSRKEEFLQMVANVLAGIIQRKHAEAALEKAYEQLKQTQSQLVQSSKMASVGELAGGVAHEINNPLTGVLNNVQLVKMLAQEKKEFSMEEYRDILNAIEQSALRCKHITELLLSFSHAAQNLFKPVRVNETVEKIIELVNHALERENITLQTQLPPDLPLVNADHQLLQQVVFDIISNARWAIRQRRQPAAEGEIRISTNVDASRENVLMEISDNGIGIPPENIEHIFDPFFTTKKVGEGTGLGLSMAYNIINQHRGSIVVSSNPGRGAVFTIRLPAVPAQ
ncbi:MAG: ATP-binding protein [Candidatus Omnitrophica bacterium]|nr:ATP-binding protein [Candidatus Omnitrophota bacterium]